MPLFTSFKLYTSLDKDKREVVKEILKLLNNGLVPEAKAILVEFGENGLIIAVPKDRLKLFEERMAKMVESATKVAQNT